MNKEQYSHPPLPGTFWRSSWLDTDCVEAKRTQKIFGGALPNRVGAPKYEFWTGNKADSVPVNQTQVQWEGGEPVNIDHEVYISTLLLVSFETYGYLEKPNIWWIAAFLFKESIYVASGHTPQNPGTDPRIPRVADDIWHQRGHYTFYYGFSKIGQ